MLLVVANLWVKYQKTNVLDVICDVTPWNIRFCSIATDSASGKKGGGFSRERAMINLCWLCSLTVWLMACRKVAWYVEKMIFALLVSFLDDLCYAFHTIPLWEWTSSQLLSKKIFVCVNTQTNTFCFVKLSQARRWSNENWMPFLFSHSNNAPVLTKFYRLRLYKVFGCSLYDNY